MSRRLKLPADTRRSAHRCCVSGCANVPRRDAIVCDIHARALGAVVADPDPQDAA